VRLVAPSPQLLFQFNSSSREKSIIDVLKHTTPSHVCHITTDRRDDLRLAVGTVEHNGGNGKVAVLN